MKRTRNYREADRPPKDPEPRGVVVRRAEPPRDPGEDLREAQREAGKLIAAQIGEDAREERSAEKTRSLVAFLVETVAALFRVA